MQLQIKWLFGLQVKVKLLLIFKAPLNIFLGIFVEEILLFLQEIHLLKLTVMADEQIFSFFIIQKEKTAL